MPRFSYEAIDDAGKRVRGQIKSGSRYELLSKIISQGYHPIEVRAILEGKTLVDKTKEFLVERVSVSDLATFTRQLASLLKAGMPVVKALSTLRKQSESPRLVKIIDDLEGILLREGATLTEALGEHPRVFNSVYRSVVYAGEQGGYLVDVLDDLASYLSQSSKLRGQVLGAFVYPAFLLLLGAVAVFVMMTFVIPRFQELFDSFGSGLPLPTKILINCSSFLSSWWWAVLLGCLAIVLVLLMCLRRDRFRTLFDSFVLRMPILGKMFLKLEISRIACTLNSLISGGVEIITALRITSGTVRNRFVRGSFASMIQEVIDGQSLAVAMSNTGVYPPLVVNLIRTGEETGDLPAMLSELAGIYEEETERAVTASVRLVEPLLIIFVGGIIAAIIAAVMLPLFQAQTMVG